MRKGKTVDLNVEWIKGRRTNREDVGNEEERGERNPRQGDTLGGKRSQEQEVETEKTRTTVTRRWDKKVE